MLPLGAIHGGTSMGPFTGLTALVTGASGGIGRATSHALADAGASVAINDLDDATLGKLAAEIEDTGQACLRLPGNLTEPETVKQVTDSVISEWGRLDILVNAAGICPSRPIENTTVEEWDQVFAVNVKAMFLCCREAISHMAGQGGGSIVNIASNAAKTAEPLIVPYSASKFAVVGLTQGLALELADRRIRVNCVCPAMCETEMMERLAVDYARLHGETVEDCKRSFHAEIPWGRMARPADVAHAICFLGNPESEFFTGQALNVSGGLEMH